MTDKNTDKTATACQKAPTFNEALQQAKSMLTGRNQWIAKYLPMSATTNQTPRDLITLAIRIAGFDFYAANSKTAEILKEQNQ